jgi:hypothetical protein
MRQGGTGHGIGRRGSSIICEDTSVGINIEASRIKERIDHQ